MPDDLDAFLQRAAQQRKARKPKIVVLDESATAPKPPPAHRPPPPPPPARPSQRPPVEPKPPTPAPEPSVFAGETVAEHVQLHMNTGEFEQRAARLGAEVDLADDKLEAHLHQVFDHQISTIAAPVGEATYQAPSADSFRTLFESMDELRRAILLKEILEPRYF
ncbi:MAG: hypothetical protein KatS3mg109_1315 [Pirellulaceae bacterium]|nr:MAG: hypothetical protein KatS3mg109_1315 [Pirellulaceae bacterium]GIW92707.1 MAG: hypothetical protein KatS3mg110_0748 [Pirellulaceae bacterium]